MYEALRRIVGHEAISVDGDALWSALPRWNPEVAHGIGTPPRCVVAPTSPDMLREVAHWCVREGMRLGAIGGKTGVDPHPVVDVAVDMTAMRSLDIDAIGLRVRAGAGWSLDALEEALLPAGLVHGHRLASGKLATVGGSIATNAAGGFSGRYGRVRSCVRGATMLAPDGTFVRRGFERALDSPAILVDVELALFPEPEARAWALLKFPTRLEAIEAMRLIVRCDARPALAMVDRENYLVLAFEGDEIVQAAGYQLGVGVALRSGGELVGGIDEGESWWETRNGADSWSANARPGVWADRLEVEAPWSVLPRLEKALEAELADAAMEFLAEIGHPTPQGARIVLSVVAETDRNGWRALLVRLRDLVDVGGGTALRGLG